MCVCSNNDSYFIKLATDFMEINKEYSNWIQAKSRISNVPNCYLIKFGDYYGLLSKDCGIPISETDRNVDQIISNIEQILSQKGIFHPDLSGKNIIYNHFDEKYRGFLFNVDVIKNK